MKMNIYQKYIPPDVISSSKYSESEQILLDVKNKYLNQIIIQRGEAKLIDFLSDLNKLDKPDSIDVLAKSLTLSDVYYYLSNLFTSNSSFEIASFKQKKVIPEKFSFFNEFGQPIWDVKLNAHPKLWNATKENGSHIFLSYIHEGCEKKYFDPLTCLFKKYNLTGLINFRIHFDNGLIEISSKNSNEIAISKSFSDVVSKCELSNINYKEITDGDIRIFDSKVDQVTHEKREGAETSTSLTRVNKKSDTRNDTLRDDLDKREFDKEHGMICYDDDKKCIVALSKGERGRIQIKSRLLPENQIKVVHHIIEMLGW